MSKTYSKRRMLSPLAILVALALLSLACATAPQSYLRVEDPYTANSMCSITVYVLALQHMCGFESIHGLWPNPAKTCDTCTTEKFSPSKISTSTLADMKKYWPTCQSGTTNEDFWSHEWSKHGTCSGLNQDIYFTKAISLFKTYRSKCSTDCHLCFSSKFSYQGVNNC